MNAKFGKVVLFIVIGLLLLAAFGLASVAYAAGPTPMPTVTVTLEVCNVKVAQVYTTSAAIPLTQTAEVTNTADVTLTKGVTFTSQVFLKETQTGKVWALLKEEAAQRQWVLLIDRSKPSDVGKWPLCADPKLVKQAVMYQMVIGASTGGSPLRAIALWLVAVGLLALAAARFDLLDRTRAWVARLIR